MKIDLMQDPMVDAMANYMTRLSKRQQVVASNIANIDTPGYQTKEISFHATLQELLSTEAVPLSTSKAGHEDLGRWGFRPLEPEVFEVQDLPSRPDCIQPRRHSLQRSF